MPPRSTGDVPPAGWGGSSIATALGLVAVVVLIGANAFFVAAEFGLVAADRTRIEKLASEGLRSAQRTLGLLRRLSFHLSGAQLGITVSSVVLGLIAEPTIATAIAPALEPIVGENAVEGVSILIALALATVTQMVFGELIPKNLVIARPDSTALHLSGAVWVYGQVARPFIHVTDSSAEWITRRLGVEPAHELHTVASLEDLEYLVDVSAEEGTLDADGARLLARSISFSTKTADDVMIPRVNVIDIDEDATVAELIELSSTTGLSRFPVTAGDVDHVVGVVHAKAAIDVGHDERSTQRVRTLVSEIRAVPESRELVSILVDMRDHRGQLVVVIDEYGGTAGIVSMEDLVEEIVGEIDDEYDDAAELTLNEGEGVYVLSGNLHPDEVEELCGFEMPEGPYETLAGFLLDELQRVPVAGEILRYDDWRIEVVEMDAHRVATLRLREPAAHVQARLRAHVTEGTPK